MHFAWQNIFYYFFNNSCFAMTIFPFAYVRKNPKRHQVFANCDDNFQWLNILATAVAEGLCMAVGILFYLFI